MKPRRVLPAIGTLLVVCLLCATVGAAAYFLGQPELAPKPVVILKAPIHGQQVGSNEMVLIHAVATDETGVTAVELWVDGDLKAEAESQLAEGSTPFPLLEGWQPESPGQHTLVVRAYNGGDRSGQASASVEALQVAGPDPSPAMHEVAQGETMESVANSYDVSVEDILDHNPGLEEPVDAGDAIVVPPPAEEEDPVRPESPPPEPLMDEGPPEEFPELEEPPLFVSALSVLPVTLMGEPARPRVPLEMEVVSLLADKLYDGVYCYCSLANSDMERVPANGDLERLGENRWGIQAHMGGENRRVVSALDEEGWLHVRINCLGYLRSAEGGEIFDLGTLEVNHPEIEWDGHRIEQTATGPDGWFRVGYEVYPLGGRGGGGEEEGELIEPPYWIAPPTNLQTTSSVVWGIHYYGLSFEYPTGDEESIGGYVVYRNGTPFLDLDLERSRPLNYGAVPGSEETKWFVPINEWDYSPPCPDRWEFCMVAYLDDAGEGRLESQPSNSVFTEGDPIPCYRRKEVTVTFEQLWVYCLNVDNCVVKSHHHYEGIGCTQECDPNMWMNPIGHVGINGERSFTIEQWVHSGIKYSLPDPHLLGMEPEDVVRTLLLGPRDDLTIGMIWWDRESLLLNMSDRFCQGTHTIPYYELQEIANQQPGQRMRTYEPEYAGGGGNCFLKFTVEVTPLVEE